MSTHPRRAAGTNRWDWASDRFVAVQQTNGLYSSATCFHPSERYPEGLFGVIEPAQPNALYRAVRDLLRKLGCDDASYGTRDWNPLSAIVRPGDTVVLKPNWIREGHLHRTGDWEQIVTHPSLIRAVADYVFLALKGTGRVVVADGPQTDSDFDEIRRRCGLDVLATFYHSRGLAFELLDLRRDRWLMDGEVITARTSLPGDPAGYVEVDIGGDSEFCSYGLNGRFYGADYDMAETRRFHVDGHHRYRLCSTPMNADVFINLPKMKTHKKTGVTLSLKNLVGINGYRNCLPHHTIGTPAMGGDEFSTSSPSQRVQSRGIVLFKQILSRRGGIGGRSARAVKMVGRSLFGSTADVIRSGNWHGNDTTWRMVLDLNKGLFYFGAGGERRSRPLRYLSIIDGFVGGDGDGPVAADAVNSGVLIGGANPLAVDTVAATLMGFDYRRIPLLKHGWEIVSLPLADFSAAEIECVSNVESWNGSLSDLERTPHLSFRPHFGWVGQIERDVVNRRIARQ